MRESSNTDQNEALGLIRFDNLQDGPNIEDSPDTRPDGFPSAQVIEQLRQRLLSHPGDSVETKVAIVGEIAYFAFRELMKRRTL